MSGLRGYKKATFLLMVLAMGLIVGLLIAVRFDLSPKLSAKGLQRTESLSRLARSEVSLQSAIVEVADEVGPAVVSISTVHTQRVPGRRLYFEGFPFDDDFFRGFFEDFFGEIPEREYRQMGLGSGVIIDSQGYILTNEHVVENADKITVTLSDGREFKAELKGTDSRSDLAVIKINARNLPVAELGNSGDVNIGEWVVAIGNPFGFALHSPQPTVTVGVISALHRSLPRTSRRDRNYTDLIQTDAAINPGNSGGPLVNLNGEVVGINVAIFTTSGGYQGVGFAIPVNVAKRIVDQLIAGKKVLYGWLGINVQDLDEDLVDYFGLSIREGVLVAGVLANSPAQEAGFKSGDIIRRFAGQEVKNVRELLSLVGQSEVGEKIKIEVIREKKSIILEAEIGERPEEIEELVEKKAEVAIWRGIEVEEITPQIQRRFRIEQTEGVVITHIESDSPADASGLAVGDVIIEISYQPIKNLADYNRVTKDAKGNLLIKTNRGYTVLKEE